MKTETILRVIGMLLAIVLMAGTAKMATAIASDSVELSGNTSVTPVFEFE